jgi:hypothetical protein
VDSSIIIRLDEDTAVLLDAAACHMGDNPRVVLYVISHKESFLIKRMVWKRCQIVLECLQMLLLILPRTRNTFGYRYLDDKFGVQCAAPL